MTSKKLPSGSCYKLNKHSLLCQLGRNWKMTSAVESLAALMCKDRYGNLFWVKVSWRLSALNRFRSQTVWYVGEQLRKAPGIGEAMSQVKKELKRMSTSGPSWRGQYDGVLWYPVWRKDYEETEAKNLASRCNVLIRMLSHDQERWNVKKFDGNKSAEVVGHWAPRPHHKWDNSESNASCSNKR